MSRTISLLLLTVALGVAGCASDELNPPPNESMDGPALSHPREPRSTADPPPPMREDLQKVHFSLITQADAPAPVPSASASAAPGPTRPADPVTVEPGTVTPLR